MNKEIRRLTMDDYDDIIRIWQIAGLPHKPNGRDSRTMMAVEMRREQCIVVGLYLDGRMVGVGMAQYDGRRGWINRVAIDPDHRGIGLGREIIAECEAWLNTFGEVVICALIEDENAPSMSCFENAGYTCENTIKYWTKRPRADL